MFILPPADAAVEPVSFPPSSRAPNVTVLHLAAAVQHRAERIEQELYAAIERRDWLAVSSLAQKHWLMARYQLAARRIPRSGAST